MAEQLLSEEIVSFIVSWVHAFTYSGEHRPAAVFLCDQKVTAWGIEWKAGHDGVVQIVPRLKYMDRVSPMVGLNVLEMQGLDNSTALLVMQERIPKSDDSITYGLILGYGILNPTLCETILIKGMLNLKDDSLFFTPDELKREWDIIDEERQESILANPIEVSTSPLRRDRSGNLSQGRRGTKCTVRQRRKRRSREQPRLVFINA